MNGVDNFEIRIGAMSPPLAEQLSQFNIPDNKLSLLQKMVDAAMLLDTFALVSDRERGLIGKRITKFIGRIIEANQVMNSGELVTDQAKG